MSLVLHPFGLSVPAVRVCEVLVNLPAGRPVQVSALYPMEREAAGCVLLVGQPAVIGEEILRTSLARAVVESKDMIGRLCFDGGIGGIPLLVGHFLSTCTDGN